MADEQQQDQPTQQQPADQEVLRFDQFQGINTLTTRPGIPPSQAAWLDGFMPIDKYNLRTLPGVGASVYTSGSSISFFYFVVLNGVPYAMVVENNAGITQLNMNSFATTTVMPPGTLSSSSMLEVGISQWNEQYALIVAPNGYWVWDGTLLYGPGTIAPVIVMTDVGSGYTGTPGVHFSGGHGSGVAATANVSGGEVISITITNPGSGYIGGDTITVTIDGPAGPGTTATADAFLMPLGINGTTVETYAGHVWIANGANIFASAPGSVYDFATSSGGVQTTSSSSVLRYAYTRLKQSNGFLYLIGDSSVDYISGVQTAGTPPTTTYSFQNADSQIGCPYPYAVDVIGRDVILANSFGVHVGYGGAFSKVSDMLNGFYNSVASFGGLLLSVAQAFLFGKKVWMMLTNIHDPILNANVQKLLMWDGKAWWTSPQDVTLQYIAYQEISSIITTWGTDGTKIYPLFTTPTSAFQKVARTKLWDSPIGYQVDKANTRFWGLFQLNTLDHPGIEVLIENETEIPGSSSILQTPSALGYYIWPPQQIAQQGVLTGFTVITSSPDMVLVAASMDAVRVQDRF